MHHPLLEEVTVKKKTRLSFKGKKKPPTDSFSIKLPVSSVLELAVGQSPGHGSVTEAAWWSEVTDLNCQKPLAAECSYGNACRKDFYQRFLAQKAEICL